MPHTAVECAAGMLIVCVVAFVSGYFFSLGESLAYRW